MLPATYQALVIIILAIEPGFLAVSCWARAKTWKGRGTDLSTILNSLAISLVIQVAAAPLTIAWLLPVRDRLPDHAWRVTVWIALVGLIVPVVGGLASGRLTDWLVPPGRLSARGWLGRWYVRAARLSYGPTIWDWIFTANIPNGCLLVIEFTDGHRVAGSFETGALALTSPESQGIFLHPEWTVDTNGDLIAPVPESRGVMIATAGATRTVRILGGSQQP